MDINIRMLTIRGSPQLPILFTTPLVPALLSINILAFYSRSDPIYTWRQHQIALFCKFFVLYSILSFLQKSMGELRTRGYIFLCYVLSEWWRIWVSTISCSLLLKATFHHVAPLFVSVLSSIHTCYSMFSRESLVIHV